MHQVGKSKAVDWFAWDPIMKEGWSRNKLKKKKDGGLASDMRALPFSQMSIMHFLF